MLGPCPPSQPLRALRAEYEPTHAAPVPATLCLVVLLLSLHRHTLRLCLPSPSIRATVESASAHASPVSAKSISFRSTVEPAPGHASPVSAESVSSHSTAKASPAYEASVPVESSPSIYCRVRCTHRICCSSWPTCAWLLCTFQPVVVMSATRRIPPS